MNFEVIKSKYTAKDVKKLLTFKRLIKMTSIIGILSGILFFFAVLFFSLYYAYRIDVIDLYATGDDNVKRLLIIASILYLCMFFCIGAFLYHELIGEKKKMIFNCYREADRLCKDLMTDQIKSGIFYADAYVDTQSNELVIVIKRDNFEIKRVYHFDRYLQQIIDEEQKIIDLSELDQIFGLDDVCKNP